ncbi:hypothetical protein AGMMS50256_34980 [Betaproteobacteria bacterium]|nr:hypothetical protein AGMMS50256_34980 [Betaproteobacteria bacterium]
MFDSRSGMRRDRYQRQAYALRRMSKAVERVVLTKDAEVKARAARWAEIWRWRAGWGPVPSVKYYPDVIGLYRPLLV